MTLTAGYVIRREEPAAKLIRYAGGFCLPPFKGEGDLVSRRAFWPVTHVPGRHLPNVPKSRTRPGNAELLENPHNNNHLSQRHRNQCGPCWYSTKVV
jgi:hypothetical protein